MKKIKLLYILLLFFGFSNSLSSFGTVYQAEISRLYKAETETKNSSYLGQSYLNFENEQGSYLELRVGLVNKSEQSIQIRYANGSSDSRTMSFALNNSIVIESLEFPGTGDWANWDTLNISVNVPAGITDIRLTSTGNEGGKNIDQLEISRKQLPHYSVNLTTNGNGSIVQNPELGVIFLCITKIELN